MPDGRDKNIIIERTVLMKRNIALLILIAFCLNLTFSGCADTSPKTVDTKKSSYGNTEYLKKIPRKRNTAVLKINRNRRTHLQMKIKMTSQKLKQYQKMMLLMHLILCVKTRALEGTMQTALTPTALTAPSKDWA